MADMGTVSGSADVDVSVSPLSGNTAKASFVNVEGNSFQIGPAKAPEAPKANVLTRLIDEMRRAKDPVGYEKKRSEATLIALRTEREIYEQYKAMYPSLGEKRLFLLAHGYNMTDAQAANVIDVFGRATELMEEVPEEAPTAEFVDGFVDSSKQAYSEDARDMFARLLAGELDSPGSYSKRAMSILANMSSENAADFRKLCTYLARINGEETLLVNPDEGHASFNDGGISHAQMIELGVLGLVDMASRCTITLPEPMPLVLEIGKGRWVILKEPGTDGKMHFSPVLTSAGWELASLCPERDEPAMVAIIDGLVAKGMFRKLPLGADGRIVE